MIDLYADKTKIIFDFVTIMKLLEKSYQLINCWNIFVQYKGFLQYSVSLD